jgi:hypothetical protein
MKSKKGRSKAKRVKRGRMPVRKGSGAHFDSVFLDDDVIEEGRVRYPNELAGYDLDEVLGVESDIVTGMAYAISRRSPKKYIPLQSHGEINIIKKENRFNDVQTTRLLVDPTTSDYGFKDMTAIEVLKTYGLQVPSGLPFQLASMLRSFVEDKQYSVEAVKFLARQNVFGRFLARLVLRGDRISNLELRDAMASATNYLVQTLGSAQTIPVSRYKGTGSENQRIDAALSNSGAFATTVGNGIAAAGSLEDAPRLTEEAFKEIRRVPIAILGYGAAGIMTARLLNRIGFELISVYDKSNNGYGIWGNENVRNGSRNNPLDLEFLDAEIPKAPGGGIHVYEFLRSLRSQGPALTTIERVHASIDNGFNHTILLSNGEKRSYPILINAMGTPKPSSMSNDEKMVFGGALSSFGQRWQRQLTNSEIRNNRFLFIGLGNSTAEMLSQLHRAEDEGIPVDYRVVTHYPKDAVLNPTERIHTNDVHTYQVFRDLSVPNLTGYQGDLQGSRRDYFRALQRGRILYDVRHWNVTTDSTGGQVFGGYRTRSLHRLTGSPDYVYSFDSPFTLTGYKRTSQEFADFGCRFDEQNRCAQFDYDGEFHHDRTLSEVDLQDAGRILSKGYFGIGAVLDGLKSKNNVVIPGMIFRLGDLSFSVVMRATEYILKQKGHL